MGGAFWPVIVVGTFLVWSASLFVGLPDKPRMSHVSIWRPRHPRIFWLALAIAPLGFGIRYLFPQPDQINNWLLAFIVDLAPEMVGMAFTVVVIDELNQQFAERQEKERIIRQMASHSNDFALDAVRQIREEKWHLDGSLRKRYFMQANLKDAELYAADLEEANLLLANLEGAYLVDANLKRANLINANLKTAKLFRAELLYADLRGAHINNADLSYANLVDADLEGANLEDANLEMADLSGVNLERAILLRTNLELADLRFANLTSANLDGANLADACLDDVELTGAQYSENTKWPEGFIPQESGAVPLDAINN